jgi:hypothetical protein
MLLKRLATVGVWLLVVAGVAVSAEQVMSLLYPLALSPGDRQLFDGGQPVVQLLQGTSPHEVAVGGAVRIGVPTERFVTLFRDIPRWKRAPMVMQLGKFGAVPTAADVADLTLDDPDLIALRRCATGRCDAKLAALASQDFQRFDWRASDAKARAESLVRAGLVRHVQDYLQRGDAALMVYEARRTVLAQEFQGVLQGFRHLEAQSPDVKRYLEAFPLRSLSGGESFIYWARETFGFKPVLSLYHVIVYRPPGRRGDAVIVSKQFFASRYFDVSLDVIGVSEGPADTSGHGCNVVYVARSRVDSLRGWIGTMKRGPAQRGAEKSVQKLLAHLKQTLETETPLAALASTRRLRMFAGAPNGE